MKLFNLFKSRNLMGCKKFISVDIFQYLHVIDIHVKAKKIMFRTGYQVNKLWALFNFAKMIHRQYVSDHHDVNQKGWIICWKDEFCEFPINHLWQFRLSLYYASGRCSRCNHNICIKTSNNKRDYAFSSFNIWWSCLQENLGSSKLFPLEDEVRWRH